MDLVARHISSRRWPLVEDRSPTAVSNGVSGVRSACSDSSSGLSRRYIPVRDSLAVICASPLPRRTALT